MKLADLFRLRCSKALTQFWPSSFRPRWRKGFSTTFYAYAIPGRFNRLRLKEAVSMKRRRRKLSSLFPRMMRLLTSLP